MAWSLLWPPGMIPIGNDDSDRTLTPVLTYLLLAANIAVFVLLQGMGANDRFTYAFATDLDAATTTRASYNTVETIEAGSGMS